MAARMARRLYLAGRPPGLPAGTRGSRMAHCSSVSRAGKAVVRNIRVGFMLQKVTWTDQRMQDYFPNRLLEPTSGDRQGLAGDVAALLAGEEQHGMSDLFRPTDAAD